MFILLLMRQGPPHIVNYYNNGTYRTICGTNYSKNSIINTLSADNTFYGICNICKHYFDSMYQSDLDSYPRDVKSSQTMFGEIVHLHRINLIGPKAKYSDAIDFRISNKIIKYKRICRRQHVKIKNGKK